MLRKTLFVDALVFVTTIEIFCGKKIRALENKFSFRILSGKRYLFMMLFYFLAVLKNDILLNIIWQDKTLPGDDAVLCYILTQEVYYELLI